MARRGPHIQLKLSLDKRGIRVKIAHFSCWFTREREKSRGKEESQASFQDLWSYVGRFSLGQEQKFIASTRGMRGYPKRGISLKIQDWRFREIEVVGLRCDAPIPGCLVDNLSTYGIPVSHIMRLIHE